VVFAAVNGRGPSYASATFQIDAMPIEPPLTRPIHDDGPYINRRLRHSVTIIQSLTVFPMSRIRDSLYRLTCPDLRCTYHSHTLCTHWAGAAADRRAAPDSPNAFSATGFQGLCGVRRHVSYRRSARLCGPHRFVLPRLLGRTIFSSARGGFCRGVSLRGISNQCLPSLKSTLFAPPILAEPR